MPIRRIATVTVLIGLTLVVACGEAGSTARSVPPADTAIPSTAMPAPAATPSEGAPEAPMSPSAPTADPSPPPPSEAGGEAPADPRVTEIEALMTAYEKADLFSGVVLVAEGGEIIYERAVGYANREWSIPNALDTRFRIASLSKLFTRILDFPSRLIHHWTLSTFPGKSPK